MKTIQAVITILFIAFAVIEATQYQVSQCVDNLRSIRSQCAQISDPHTREALQAQCDAIINSCSACLVTNPYVDVLPVPAQTSQCLQIINASPLTSLASFIKNLLENIVLLLNQALWNLIVSLSAQICLYYNPICALPCYVP